MSEKVPSAIGKVLVAVDGSENANRAAEYAIEIAKRYNAKLVVLNVIATPLFLATESSISTGADFSSYWRYARSDAEKILDRITSVARQEGVDVKTEIIANVSSITQAIVNYAKNEKIDLIVIGTRGLGGFKKLLMGSVSSGVVSHAQCSVLVVR